MVSGWIKSFQRSGLNRFHPYHMVKPSIWPFLTSLALLFLVVSMISTFYETHRLMLVFHVGSLNVFLVLSLTFLFVSMFGWWSDVSIESGEHTSYVIKGLKIGMVLFIVSEVLFFFSFFWALFHVSLSPDIQLGGVWPPVGFESMVLDFKKVPLLNTVLLLSSGITVTYAHLAFFVNFNLTEPLFVSDQDDAQRFVEGISSMKNEKESLENQFFVYLLIKLNKLWRLYPWMGGVKTTPAVYEEKNIARQIQATQGLIRGLWAMFLTISFALLFLSLQLMEYFEAFFSISDSVYGSTFFVMTGFHGLHVLVGTIFLIISTYRIASGNFLGRHSTGLECAIWYWHFVDVVWLFLYISIYYWGNIVIADFNYDVYFRENVVDVRSDCPEIESCFFQDPATGFMEKIVDLHNYIMQILIVIAFVIFFILYDIIYE